MIETSPDYWQERQTGEFYTVLRNTNPQMLEFYGTVSQGAKEYLTKGYDFGAQLCEDNHDQTTEFLDRNIGMSLLDRGFDVLQDLIGLPAPARKHVLERQLRGHEDTLKVFGVSTFDGYNGTYQPKIDIVILNESITGQELFALALHEEGHRWSMTTSDWMTHTEAKPDNSGNNTTLSMLGSGALYSSLGTLESRGAAIEEAFAEKCSQIATTTVLGTNYHDLIGHELIDKYRRKTGKMSFNAPFSMGFDILNEAAGFTDEFGIYRYIFEYTQSGRDDAARKELDEIILKASKGHLNMNAIDQFEYPDSVHGALGMLLTVELACDVPFGKRASSILRRTFRPAIIELDTMPLEPIGLRNGE